MKAQTDLAVQLIDSSFTKEEAYEVIMALLDHKINFHQRKRFSDRERFSRDLRKSELRIQELKQEKEQVKAYFQGLGEDRSIEVSSLVRLSDVTEREERKTA